MSLANQINLNVLGVTGVLKKSYAYVQTFEDQNWDDSQWIINDDENYLRI
jgi:hypothetical protein